MKVEKEIKTKTYHNALGISHFFPFQNLANLGYFFP
jgi:hypothetical protein